MNNCSQSLPHSGISSCSYLLAPSGEINITNIIFPKNLPLEMWDNIFDYLVFKDLKLFTEHKVRVLKKPLEGNEDNNRLMMGKTFIFHKNFFLEIVKNVYNLALCCKVFYVLTQRERMLLINAAKWARIDKEFLFSDQTPTREKQDENRFSKIDGILRMRDPTDFQYKHLIPKPSLEIFIPVVTMEEITKKLRDLESKPIKLKLELYEKLSKPTKLDLELYENFFEKFKLTVNKNQEILKKKKQPIDSD